MFLSTAIPLAALFVSPVWAQLDSARCSTGFDWNRNSLGQDPCTVGSILDASCRGLKYTYPPLDSTQYYLPPKANHSGDVMCDCNTVMYSLYMACASCQGGEIYSWAKWIPECSSVYVSQYPASIPEGIAVPRWAYYDITSLPDQTWNESVVTNIGQQPEEILKRAASDPPPVSVPPPASVPPPVTITTTNQQGKTTSIRDPAGMSTPVPADPTPNNTPNPPDPTNPNPPDPTTPNSPDPVIPTDTTNPPNPSVPTDTTNSPGGPTTPVSNPNLPGPTISTGSTSSPRSTNPTSSSSSGRPANPFGTNANSPSPTSNGSGKGATNVWTIFVVVFLWALM